MAGDLFSASASAHLATCGPLAFRLRPRSLEEVVGQRHLVGPGAPMRALLEADRLSSVILWGPPGSGKTTLASLVASTTTKAFVALSAVSAGVKEVREVISEAHSRLGSHRQGTVLFIDEIHRFNRAQQDALLGAVEQGVVVLVGATTENPYFELNGPLLSRSTLWRLNPLSDEDIVELAERAARLEQVELEPAAEEALVELACGDGRAALSTLEVAIALAETEPGTGSGNVPRRVSADHVVRARAGPAVRYGRDIHFDMASAFIKSIRGSDPDAGLYWMARMLEAGDDARFIARRLLILASEDIGLADPTSLLVAEAAARAAEHVGLPEAGLNLAQAVVHLALAPKSNTVTAALARARQDAVRTSGLAVPAHLRDAHYGGATSLGHGEGYTYPHDDPLGWVDQTYLPSELTGRQYYRPGTHGREPELARRWPGRHDEAN